MQTFDAAGLSAMALKLIAAADAGAWEQLAQLDTLLQRCAMQGQSVTDASVSAAWQAVHQAHSRAMAVCQQAKQEAGLQLRSLQDTQAAQQAYAWQEVLA